MNLLNHDFASADSQLGSQPSASMATALGDESYNVPQDCFVFMDAGAPSNNHGAYLENWQSQASQEPVPSMNDYSFSFQGPTGAVVFDDDQAFLEAATSQFQALPEGPELSFVEPELSLVEPELLPEVTDENLRAFLESEFANGFTNEQFLSPETQLHIQAQAQYEFQASAFVPATPAQADPSLSFQAQSSSASMATDFASSWPYSVQESPYSMQQSSSSVQTLPFSDFNNINQAPSFPVDPIPETLQYATYQGTALRPENTYYGEVGSTSTFTNVPYIDSAVERHLDAGLATNQLVEDTHGGFAANFTHSNFAETNLDLLNLLPNVDPTLEATGDVFEPASAGEASPSSTSSEETESTSSEETASTYSEETESTYSEETASTSSVEISTTPVSPKPRRKVRFALDDEPESPSEEAENVPQSPLDVVANDDVTNNWVSMDPPQMLVCPADIFGYDPLAMEYLASYQYAASLFSSQTLHTDDRFQMEGSSHSDETSTGEASTGEASTSEAQTLDTSSLPRTMTNTSAPAISGNNPPLTAEAQANVALEARQAIANLGQAESRRMAERHDCLNSTQSDANADDGKVGKPKKSKKPKKPKGPSKDKREFDYSNVHVPHTVVPMPHLQNTARNAHLDNGLHKDQLQESSGFAEGYINRTRYHRGNIDVLHNLHPHVMYQRNPLFDINRPYQQEFTRVQLNPLTGATINTTRSGLCPYCEEINFYELKNSCYSQHMSHSHGVHTDGFLTPNPLLPGEYTVTKKMTEKRKTIARPRIHFGVVCPACYLVVETGCWASTVEKNPYSNYLRHFKEDHRIDKSSDAYFQKYVGVDMI